LRKAKYRPLAGREQGLRFFRRSLITLGVAATLPTVVFVAVGAFCFLRAERADQLVPPGQNNVREFYLRVERVKMANLCNRASLDPSELTCPIRLENPPTPSS
jgi:hypothetical protein